MQRAISTQTLFVTAAIGELAVGAYGVRSASIAISDYFIQRDNRFLAEAIGPHNIHNNRISDAFAEQLAQAVFPRITDAHTKIRASTSHIFFVKPNDVGEAYSVIMSGSQSNHEGTYFRVRSGIKTTTYSCIGTQQIYVEAHSALSRHKTHVADVSAKCSDITSGRHIAINRDKTSFAHRIPNSLRDEIVLGLPDDALYAPYPRVQLDETTYKVRRMETPHYSDKLRPFAFIGGAMHRCELALSASTVTGYIDKSDQPAKPIFSVYTCRNMGIKVTAETNPQ